MKKIPTLFVRKFENHKIVEVTPEITPGCEEAFLHGVATEKMDGSCCCVQNGILYKRYDAKKGKTPPLGAIPCCDPDPVTGHWPHWIAVDPTDKGDKWFWESWCKTFEIYGHRPEDGTYEAIGPHFQANPYDMSVDILVPHGEQHIEGLDRSFEGIKKYLEENEIEGIVFWLDDEPVCKIKRTDFGLKWPIKES